MSARICAGGVLFREERFLLGLRSRGLTSYPGKWDVFGGHCESGESVEQALTRELLEELAIIPTAWECLGVFAEPDPAANGPAEYHLFVIGSWSGVPRNASAEHERIAWFTLDELAALDLAAREYIEIFATLAGLPTPTSRE